MNGCRTRIWRAYGKRAKQAVSLVVVLLAVVRCAWAQPQLKLFGENKKTDVALLEQGQCVGWQGEASCWVSKERGDKVQVVWLNHDMATLGRAELALGKNGSLLSATTDGVSLRLLSVSSPDRGHTVVSAARMPFDTASSGFSPMVEVDSFTHEPKDRCLVWAAASLSGEYQAVVSVVEMRKSKEYRARVRLLDAELHSLWHRDFALKSLEQVCVTDRGEVVTMGYEREGAENHILFNIASDSRAESYDVALECPPIADLQLMGVVGRHVMAVGIFAPEGSKPKEEVCGGTVGLSFQMDSAALTGISFKPLQYDDLCVLLNSKSGRRLPDAVAHHGKVTASVLTSWGAVVAVGCHTQKMKVEANGMETAINRRVGLHVVAFDTLGEVRKVTNIRRNDVQKHSDALLKVELVPQADELLLFKSEHVKGFPTTPGAKPAKEFEAGGKSNLVAYHIGTEVEPERRGLEVKTPHGLLHVVRHPDGTLRLFTADGRRLRQAAYGMQ